METGGSDVGGGKNFSKESANSRDNHRFDWARQEEDIDQQQEKYAQQHTKQHPLPSKGCDSGSGCGG